MPPNSFKTDISKYNNSWYSTGAGVTKRTIWFFVNALFLMTPIFPISGFKVWLLRLFGAKIGIGVNIKPSVNIKYPWLLRIGNYCWIGEKVWIDNLTIIDIGDNVCLSQGAFLLTGNHNYTKVAFDLITNKIILEDGVWIGARSIVCPGVTCKSHAVLAVGSIASKDLEPYTIYRGNPAVAVKERVIMTPNII